MEKTIKNSPDPLNPSWLTAGMGYRKTILDNGVRVITEEIPYLKSVSIGVWVTTGSRDEQPHENGVSHFIEHLLFKGTERRTAFDIAKEIDSVGGTLNAFTGREYTCFYAKVIDKNLPLAINLLSDIFLHSLMDPKDVEKERGVILQEIKMVEDTPDDYIHDFFNRVCWGDHPLGFPIFGTSDLVQSFTREQIFQFLKETYQPERIIICAAGNLKHEEAVDLIGETFGQLPQSNQERKRLKPQSVSTTNIRKRELEQVHFCLGTKGLPYNHSLRFASYLLNTILGGGMSSRLFQEIRENRGLAYSVGSYTSHLRDTGAMVLYAGVPPAKAADVVSAMMEQLAAMRDKAVPTEELNKAREFTKGRLLLRMEDTFANARWVGHQEVTDQTVLSVDQVVEELDAITVDDVQHVAQRLFATERLSLAIVGPFRKEREFRHRLGL